MNMIWPLWSVYIPLMALRVVCGVGAVMLTFISQIVFMSVDFPTLGRPTTATDAHFVFFVSSSLFIRFSLYSKA